MAAARMESGDSCVLQAPSLQHGRERRAQVGCAGVVQVDRPSSVGGSAHRDFGAGLGKGCRADQKKARKTADLDLAATILIANVGAAVSMRASVRCSTLVPEAGRASGVVGIWMRP